MRETKAPSEILAFPNFESAVTPYKKQIPRYALDDKTRIIQTYLTVVTLALVPPVLRTRASLDRFHPAFGGMQLRRLVRGFVRLEARVWHVRVLAVQKLPGLEFAVMCLLLL